MRTAAVMVLGLLATGCKSKHEPPPATTGTPATPTPVATADAAAAAVAAEPVAAEPSIDSKKPIEVKRTHAIGQRYAITMTHTGLITETYNAEGTVTDVKDGGFQIAVLIKSLSVAAPGAPERPPLKDAALEVWVRPHDGSGSVDAEQLAGPDLSMYLTPIEIMLGDGGWPPAGAHVAGDKWTVNSTDWVFVGVEAKSGINYAHYTTKQTYRDNGGGQTSDLLLAVRDGYLGHVTLTQTLKMNGKEDAQTYDLSVTPLAPSKAE